jgi:Effector Associated Constant Component 1
VNASIALLDGDGHDMVSLYNWLRSDPDVRPVRVSLDGSRPHGAMGAVDVISMTLDHATAISAVLIAFASWRRSRPRPPDVTIRIDGTTVQVPRDMPVDELAGLIDALASRTGDGGSDGPAET